MLTSTEQRALDELTRILRPKWLERGKHSAFRWKVDNLFVEGTMARLTTEEMFDAVSVVPRTAQGNPAVIDGDVTMRSSDPAVATIEVLGSNLFRILSGVKGASQIEAEFDADLGEGVRTVLLTGAVEVVDAEAVTGEIVFGEPVLKDTSISGETGNVTPE